MGYFNMEMLMPKLNVDEIVANLKTGVRKNDDNDKKEFSMVSIICGAGEGFKQKSQIKYTVDNRLNDVSMLLKRKLDEDFEVSISREAANKISFANEDALAKYLELLT